MSFVREAIRDKPVGLWLANAANPLNDISGYGRNGSGTYGTALGLCANQKNSYVLDQSHIGKFPSPVFQQGKESQAFSLEAWVRPVQKTTGYTAQPYHENLIENPAAVVNLTGWGPIGTDGGATTRVNDGASPVQNYYARKTASGTANSTGLGVNNQVSLPVGQYTASFFLRSSVALTSFQIYLQGTATKTGNSKTTGNIAANKWYRLSITFNITAPGTVQVGGYYDGTLASGTNLDITGAMLEVGGTLNSYIDGSLSNCEWEGAANASRSRTRLDISLVNYTNNPSFEVDSNSDGLSDSWSSYAAGTTGNITRSIVTSATNGSYAQRVQADGLAAGGGNRVGISQGQIMYLVPGDTITISVNISIGTLPTGAVARIHADLSNNTWIEGGDTGFTTSGRKTYTYTVQNYEVSRIAVYLWVDGGTLAAASAVDVTFDSVVVVKNNNFTAYFDGGTPGAIWAGTSPTSNSLMLTSNNEQQILGNAGQHDGLTIDGTNVSFVTKYLTNGEARASYDIQMPSNIHVFGVHTSEKNSLYVNGELVSEEDISDVQAADSFLASDGYLYSGQTLSSRQIMSNGITIYSYAVSPDAIARHYAMGTATVGPDTPVPYSGAVVRVSKNTNDILFDRYWQSDEDWKSADISGLTVDDAQLVPQQINGTSVFGTWIDTCDLYDGGVANTIHSVVVNWDGIGATVEASVDGTTWEACSRGVALTSIPAGFDPTDKELYMRVTFPGGIVDDASYLDNLNVTAFKTGSVTTSANRTVTYTAPAYIKREYDPAVLSDDWGVELAGGYVLLGPDTSDEPTGYQSLEVWFKFKDSSIDSRFIDARDANNANNPLVAFQWTLGKIGGSGFYLYKNGISIPYGNGNLPEVGQWQVWHFVATAPVLTSTYINKLYSGNGYSGNVQVGRVVAYDDALTATQVANIVSSYTGHLVNNLTETEAVTVTEPTTSAQIYAHDWSIEASG